MTKKKRLRGIYVEWYDATTKGGWHEIEDCKLILCITLGFLMNETKDFITVCTTTDLKDEQNGYGGMISSNTIPKAWIKKKKWIKYD